MKIKEQQLSTIAKACNSQLVGEDLTITDIAASPDLAKETELALVFPHKIAKAMKMLANSQAKALVVHEAIVKEEKLQELVKERGLSLVVSARPRYALQQILPLFAKARLEVAGGIHASAVVDVSAEVDVSAKIGPLCYIGPNSKISAGTVLQARVSVGANVEIGQDCQFHSGAVIEDNVVIGSRVIMQANAVVGSDGYSYVTEEPSNLEKLQGQDFSFKFDRQVNHKIISNGGVIIADDVEIGANSCVDAGTIGATYIGEGTKIDNLCQIAHNVELGKDCLIVSGTGIAGSVKIADRVTMAGGSGCGDGVEIGNDVFVDHLKST